jgi:hypothetical protein
MPLHPTPDDGLGRNCLLDIILADDLDAGFDGLTDLFRSPGLGGGDELDVGWESLKDGSDAIPDHEVMITQNRDRIQEGKLKKGWTCDIIIEATLEG